MLMRASAARPLPQFEGVLSYGHVDPALHVGGRGNWGKAARKARISGKLSGVRQGGSSPDAAKIEAASIAFGSSLNNRLQRPDVLHTQFAKLLRTNKLLNVELWLNSIPKMRLWEGDKVLSMFTAEQLRIITRPHEASVMIPKGDIINDELGLYTDKINSLGDSYMWHLDEMLICMLIGGLQGTAFGTTYDGQNLIDVDHTFRGNGTGPTYSNKVTGAFSATTYRQAWNLFLQMKDENGLPLQPMGGKRLTLLHGPANRDAVRTVLQQENIVGVTASNIDKGTATPYCSEWITAGATYSLFGQTVTLTGLEWFLIPQGSSAVMIQIKRDPEFLAVDRGDDEFTFRTGKLLYGLESEDGAAYGMPQEIVGGPGA